MTLDEKLEQFYNAAMESATNQNLQIVEEYEKSLKQIYEEQREEGLRKADITYQVESEKLIREKNRELSNETIQLKRRLSEKSLELTENLFEDVANALTEYMKTSNYFDLLIKQIKEAKSFAGEDEIIIYINPSDITIKKSLEDNTKAVLTISDRDFIGGTRAVLKDKNILIDNSFSTRLAEYRDTFTLSFNN